MAELIQFLESVKDKTKNTLASYKVQYNKLYKLTEKPIAETSESKLIELIKEQPNPNQQQALINVAIQVRRLEKLAVTKLEVLREKNKVLLREHVKDTNLKLQQSLPSYAEIVDYMKNLYESGSWTDYIINYLLINYQVRNVDVNFDIVPRKKDATDPEKNYMWLTGKKAVYIRNVYKTAGTYGKKVITITDPLFLSAVKRVVYCQKHNKECGVFIPNENQVGYYVLNATYKKLGEGNYFKIVVDHYRNDLGMIQKISENRGTSISTILNSYDIANV